jgi:glycosyltransferase involved in cell wall biosynthesis
MITVVICTWNRAELLDQTLTQMHQLRIPSGMEWELIVVNNDCSDHTDRVIASHAVHLPIVRVFEGKPGQGHARNAGLRAARGEYLLWTDDDVLVDPSWVEATLNAFETFGADLIYGKAEPWWEVPPPSWFSSLFLGHFALVDLGTQPLVITDPKRSGFGVNHAFRTATLRELGGYCPELGYCKSGGGAGEDMDMFTRTFDAGKIIAYTPHSIVHHFIPSARCSKTFHRQRAWSGGDAHLKLLLSETCERPHLPAFLGIPRYYFRLHCDFFLGYVASLLKGDPSRAFFYELKLIRFASILRVLVRRERRKDTNKDDNHGGDLSTLTPSVEQTTP